MKIEYLGHSSFRIESAEGKSIVTDPYGGVGFFMPSVSADIVTVSHGHFDHNNVGAVHASICLSSEGCHSAYGLEVEAIPCFHDEVRGRKRGKNLIFKFLIDGIRVCHFGDLGEPCSPALIEKIGSVDVLLLPIGGNYTIDAAEAKRYVEAVRPAVVIPMHYKVDDLNVDVAGPQEFLAYFSDVERAGSVIALSSDDINKGMKVVYMERRR